ncbi:hypothetical protein MRB53_022239 [Persea americana]|uniref:Uncharacterized protein n=1 Tax=Persea americana TaxID=3435 RepID=A0ACC2L5X3_PERAE|nr:hypothetical protein MRB53_022239 [Persea americana]
MSPSSKNQHGASSSSSPYGRRRDEEQDSFGEEISEEEDDTFTIPSKNVTIEHHRKWTHATLVLNAARRFRYTLNLKKEEEKEETKQKIRMHPQVIQAALLFNEAGEKQLPGTLTILRFISYHRVLIRNASTLLFA